MSVWHAIACGDATGPRRRESVRAGKNTITMDVLWDCQTLRAEKKGGGRRGSICSDSLFRVLPRINTKLGRRGQTADWTVEYHDGTEKTNTGTNINKSSGGGRATAGERARERATAGDRRRRPKADRATAGERANIRRRAIDERHPRPPER